MKSSQINFILLEDKKRQSKFEFLVYCIRVLYKKHLKKYSVIRALVQVLWNVFVFPLAKITLRLKGYFLASDRIFRVINLKKWAERKQFPLTKLVNECSVETPSPLSFPSGDTYYLKSPHDFYNFPNIFLVTIKNASIFGGSNLIFESGSVIFHDLFKYHVDTTSEELHLKITFNHNANYVQLHTDDSHPFKLEVAASFLDACAHNYAHWITEVLPRIAVFCDDDRFETIPLLIDFGLHPNILESLSYIVGKKRTIYMVPPGRKVVFDKLYAVSVAGYVPFGWREGSNLEPCHGLFSPNALSLIREKVYGVSKKINGLKHFEKIFIRRNSSYRNLKNAAEIESTLIEQGFAIFEPEKMNFLEQVELFRNAKVIVGVTGAAMANILFASDSAKIVILIGKYKNTAYWYWQNIACATKKQVIYLFGKPEMHGLNGIHSNITVDPQQLLQVISTL